MIHQIYAYYGGKQVFGEIDTERIFRTVRGPEGYGYCVRLLDGPSSWLTATGAQIAVTGTDGDSRISTIRMSQSMYYYFVGVELDE